MKHGNALLICFLMLLTFSFLAQNSAAGSPDTYPGRVYDAYGVLTDEEYDKVLAALDDVSSRHRMDTAVFVVRSVAEYGYRNIAAFSDDVYDQNGYGMGEDDSGILLVIAMEEREWYITTCGRAISCITDAGLDLLEEHFGSYLSAGEYAEAFLAYAAECDYLYTQAENGLPYGSTTYSVPIWVWLGSSLAGGLFFSMIPMGRMKGALKTVKAQQGAAEYAKMDSLRITNVRDLFLYSTVHKVKRETESPPHSGNSRVHTSSSGRTHGGARGSF